MIKCLSLILLLLGPHVWAGNIDLKLACRAASAGMPDGLGTPVNYPDGKLLTSSSGKAGATWYYPDGRTLTSSMGIAGATFYYPSGATLSPSFGAQGATWYFPDGKTITSSGPSLTPLEMAEAACTLLGAD